jgi:hypothetical protein
VDHLSLAAGVLHERSGATSLLFEHLRLASAYRLIPMSMAVHGGDY